MLRQRLLPNWRRAFRGPSITQQTQGARRLQSSQASRIDRFTSKLPKRLQKYTQGLRNAPVSHVVSFLILHELTAIVPVVGLFAFFHYTTYAPVGYMTEYFGEYVQSGVSRFEKYFKRKEWFGFTKDTDASEGEGGKVTTHQTDEILRRMEGGDTKYKVLVEVALAWAITKAILPLRIIGSVWATPWFAGVLVRTRAAFTRKG